MKYAWLASVSAAVMSVGCNAIVEDLRPDELRPQTSPDAGVVSPNADAGLTDGGFLDAGPNVTLEEVVLSAGQFVELDYEITGTSEVVRLADGSLELRMSPDFRSFAVPGPVVVFSNRDLIGRIIQADDLRIGALTSNSGAQSYTVPSGAENFRYVFVYCEPFGLEVGRAELLPVP